MWEGEMATGLGFQRAGRRATAGRAVRPASRRYGWAHYRAGGAVCPSPSCARMSENRLAPYVNLGLARWSCRGQCHLISQGVELLHVPSHNGLRVSRSRGLRLALLRLQLAVWCAGLEQI